MYCDLLINDVIKLLFLNFASVIVHVYLLAITKEEEVISPKLKLDY
jgi:hypothetical protein